jgi:hypothetical protein
MTKLFRDVNYYIGQASNSTQREFELDFADVIAVFDTDETTIITEDNRELIISWCERGYFKSYYVVPLTQKMGVHPGRVEQVIDILRDIDVDGETLQYIIEKVGMTDQMLRQLVMNNPYTDTSDLLEEKVRLSDEFLRSSSKNN